MYTLCVGFQIATQMLKLRRIYITFQDEFQIEHFAMFIYIYEKGVYFPVLLCQLNVP
jgi:hypothetical protein